MSNELLYNDGEGLDFNDLNGMQRLMRRELYDEFLRDLLWNPGDVESAATLRPVGQALGLPNPVGAGSVTPARGQVIFDPGSDPGSPDYRYLTAYCPGTQSFTITANALGGTRYDLICAKIAQVYGSSESRDFKDATTGALSTVSENKRRTGTLTLQYVTGTVITTDPAVPAGYTKIGRVEVSNGTSVVAKYTDYRVPAGSTLIHVPLALGAPYDPSNGGWKAKAGSGGTIITPAQINVNASTYLPLAPPRPWKDTASWNTGSVFDGAANQLLLRRIHVSAQVSDGTGARKVELWGGIGSGSPALIQSFTSSFTSGVLAQVSLTPTAPVWINGDTKPGPSIYGGILSGLALFLQANANTDALYALAAEFYGGL